MHLGNREVMQKVPVNAGKAKCQLSRMDELIHRRTDLNTAGYSRVDSRKKKRRQGGQILTIKEERKSRRKMAKKRKYLHEKSKGREDKRGMGDRAK